jgi:hypothetical protein
MKTALKWALACLAAIGLQAGTASAHGPVDPRICKRHHLSEATQRWCQSIQGLRGRALYKATVLENLRRTNKPPVADLELSLILPGRVKLDASGSFDEDGFPVFYTFSLFDADTGDSIANPMTSREPYGDLEVPGGSLPPRMRASVIVEDDERATDTAELTIP